MSIQANTSIENSLKKFKELDEKISHYEELLGVVNWDMQTGAPKKGKRLRSKALGTLSADVFSLGLSSEMGECLHVLSDDEAQVQLDEVTQAKIRERKRHYDKSKQIPPEEYRQFVVLTSDAHDTWAEAKQSKDFSLFEEDLSQIVSFQKKFIEYYGYEEHPYDALLDNYEPGFTVAKLDPLFADLRQHTTELLERIKASDNQPDESIFKQSFPIDQQKAFSLHILPKLGYDLEAGRLDESAHPFATGLNTQDVRVTTRFDEHDMRSAIFGTIHECGHALYEQGIRTDFNGSVLASGTSMGIHESQSRFVENMMGRSAAFWTYFYDDLKHHFPNRFDHVPLQQFTRAINTVKPSLLRVESDELTYNLHIMLRYDIEKKLMNGEYEVHDLPDIWKESMSRDLGVAPAHDGEGVLQDIHWAMGGFGYFPSYTLGNLYAAQFYYTLRQQLPDMDTIMQQGEFLIIRGWLGQNIHQYGQMLTPNELIRKVTGEELSAKYLVTYLQDKYTQIYAI